MTMTASGGPHGEHQADAPKTTLTTETVPLRRVGPSREIRQADPPQTSQPQQVGDLLEDSGYGHGV